MTEISETTTESEGATRRNALAGLAAALGGAMVFTASGPAEAVENKKGDRCLTVLFPNGPGVKFDIDYYVNHHIPLIFSLYGKSIRNYEVFQAQASPNGPPPQFLAMANIWIADEEAFAQAGRDHAKDFAPDVPNFTNAKTMSMNNVVYKVVDNPNG